MFSLIYVCDRLPPSSPFSYKTNTKNFIVAQIYDHLYQIISLLSPYGFLLFLLNDLVIRTHPFFFTLEHLFTLWIEMHLRFYEICPCPFFRVPHLRPHPSIYPTLEDI